MGEGLSELDVRYRFLALLGEGGFGKVYRARLEGAHGFHKDVAVKLLNRADPPPGLIRRFRDESRILGLVRDRAVVSVEPPVRIGPCWAVIMDFVDGQSMGHLLEAGPIPPGVAVEIVGEVARALHNVFHMDGPSGQPLCLLHRDIKPGNIQLTPAGEVKLLDFGIARADFAEREAQTRGLGGTPGYIAPERLHGIEGPAGDVFSLGVVLHELVTGDRPTWDGTSQGHADPQIAEVVELAAVMRSVDAAKRPSAREVEKRCRRLRQRLDEPYLRDWAEDRVAPHSEMEADSLVGQVLAVRATDDTEEAPRPQPWLRWIATGAAAALGIGLIVGTWIHLTADRGPDAIAVAVGTPARTEALRLPPPTPIVVEVEGEAEARPRPEVDEVRPPPRPRIAAPRPIPVPSQTEDPEPKGGTSDDTSAPASEDTAAERVEIPSPEPPASIPIGSGPTWRITLVSNPLGAEVQLVDQGMDLGRAPVFSDLPAGTYRVKMSNAADSSMTTIRVGRRMPTRYVWKVAEDRWVSGY